MRLAKPGATAVPDSNHSPGSQREDNRPMHKQNLKQEEELGDAPEILQSGRCSHSTDSLI